MPADAEPTGHCSVARCGELRKQGRPPHGWVQIKIAMGGDHRGAQPWYCGAACAGRALGVTVDNIEPTVRVVERRVFVVPPERTTFITPKQTPLEIPDALALLNVFAGCHLTVQTATPARVRHAIETAARRVLADLAEWQRVQDRDRPSLAEVQDEASSGRVRHDVPRAVLEQEGWRIPESDEPAESEIA